LHKIQRKILSKLTKVIAQRYSSLQKGFDIDDKFAYHLKYLVNKKFIKKINTEYCITSQGLKQISQFDKQSLKHLDFKQTRFLLVCKFKNKILIARYNSDDPNRKIVYTLPGGKLLFGQNIDKTIKNKVNNNLGLLGKISFKGIHNNIEFLPKNNPLYDDLFLIYEILVSKKLKKRKNHIWKTIEEIKKLKIIHPPLRELVLKNNLNKIYSNSKYYKNREIKLTTSSWKSEKVINMRFKF